MAKTEKFDIPLKCPECDKEGSATLEENENPAYSGGLNIKISSVSAGFSNRGADIICDTCKGLVKTI